MKAPYSGTSLAAGMFLAQQRLSLRGAVLVPRALRCLDTDHLQLHATVYSHLHGREIPSGLTGISPALVHLQLSTHDTCLDRMRRNTQEAVSAPACLPEFCRVNLTGTKMR